ncbi:IS21 family transposase [Desulfotomaculum defluvii]
MKIVECREAGLNKTATAKKLSIHRETVAKYWDTNDPSQVKTGFNRPSKLDPYKEYIINRLQKWPELSAQRIFEEIQVKGYPGSERNVRRYVATVRPKKVREFKPYETMPGEQAQIDWGHCGEIIENGHRKKLYVFVFCLGWSRVRYVEFITSLNMAVFNGCLHRALQYVVGVPGTILFDNAKTVVSERVGTIVKFNENLLQLALKYGFTPKACWVSDPETKGKVESNVKYVKRGFFYAREFNGLRNLNDQAQTWLNTIANKKVHGTTGCVPMEQLVEEQAYLKPIPNIDTPLPVYESRKATKTSLISIDNNKYSVPSFLSRKTVNYQRYEDHIEIIHQNKVIAKHRLNQGKGKTVMDDAHYPEHNKQKAPRKCALQTEFEALALEAAAYLQGLSRYQPGHLRRQMEEIIQLSKQYDSEAINQAMKRSLSFNAFGYSTLKRILKKQALDPKSLPDAPDKKRKKELDTSYQVDVEKRDMNYYGGVVS